MISFPHLQTALWEATIADGRLIGKRRLIANSKLGPPPGELLQDHLIEHLDARASTFDRALALKSRDAGTLVTAGLPAGARALDLWADYRYGAVLFWVDRELDLFDRITRPCISIRRGSLQMVSGSRALASRSCSERLLG